LRIVYGDETLNVSKMVKGHLWTKNGVVDRQLQKITNIREIRNLVQSYGRFTRLKYGEYRFSVKHLKDSLGARDFFHAFRYKTNQKREY